VAVIVSVVIAVPVAALGRGALGRAGASVELVSAIELGVDVYQPGYQGGDGRVVFPGVGIGPEVLVQEGVYVVGAEAALYAGALHEPAAVLAHDVQQQHAVVLAVAADAPGAE